MEYSLARHRVKTGDDLMRNSEGSVEKTTVTDVESITISSSLRLKKFVGLFF